MLYSINTTNAQDIALADYLASRSDGLTAGEYIASLVSAQLDLLVAQMRAGDRAALIAKFEALDQATQQSLKATLDSEFAKLGA